MMVTVRLLLATALLLQPVRGGCGNRSASAGGTCYSCTSDYGCAWCQQGTLIGTCTSTWNADETRPSPQTDCTKWSFQPTECPAVSCASLRTCMSCLSSPISFQNGQYTGCGWCNSTQLCSAGTWLGSSTGACGGSNWTFGTGRCSCFKGCDNCTQNNCGWCETTGTCMQGASFAGSMGPILPSVDYTVMDPTLAKAQEAVWNQTRTHHKWESFRNGPGYHNIEQTLCPDWHWSSCPCEYYMTCERCLLKGSCSWCIPRPEATKGQGVCLRMVDAVRQCSRDSNLDWGCTDLQFF
mmetsp:Transcript_36800/g.82949  ORF Transcript_36800/g.82949 Transcript_36800/m.82949 type:complete len:295 (-) Transcript_36800:75-959(-)